MTKQSLFLFFCLLMSTLSAEDAMKLIGSNHDFFNIQKETFLPASGKSLFVWTTEAKIEAYYPADPKSKEKLTLFGQEVTSALVRTTHDHPSFICFTLYQRDEKHNISAEKFIGNMKSIFAALKKRYPKVKPKLLREKRTDDLHVNALVWKSGKYACLMKWAIRGNTKLARRPEYLQVEFELLNPSVDPLKRSIAKTTYSRPYFQKSLTSNVRRKNNGDVYIDLIPMIKLSDKENSAIGTVQRLLKYYKIESSKKLALKPSKKGAKFNSDIEELNLQMMELCTEQKLKIIPEILVFHKDRSGRKLENIIGHYNRTAKSNDKPKIEISVKGGNAPVTEAFKKMLPEILFKVRNEDRITMKFQEEISKNIMNGTPMIWYMIPGIAKEAKPHPKSDKALMRLIVGFNFTTRNVIYSDCLGAGHELKMMPFDQAWPVTLAIYSVKPKDPEK